MRTTLLIFVGLAIFGSAFADQFFVDQFNARNLLQLPDGASLPSNPGNVRFCGATGTGAIGSNSTQCDFVAYGTSLAYSAAPGIVFGIISFIAWIVFSIITCCTWCKNCLCCGGSKAPIWIITYIVYGIGTAAIVIGFIVALVGDKGVTANVTNTENTVIGVFDHLINGVNQIQVALTDPAFTEFVPANQTAGISQSLQQAKDSIGTIRGATVSVKDTTDSFLYYREVAVLVSIVIPLGFAAIAILLRFIKLPSMCLALAAATCFWMIILWLSFTIHLVVDRVVTDVCFEANLILNDPNLAAAGNASLAPAGIGAFSQIINCANGNGGFNNLLSLTEGTLDGAISSACVAIQNACNVNGTNCDPIAFANPCNLTTLLQFKNTSISDPAFQCTVGGTPGVFVENPNSCDVPASATFVSQNVTVANCASLCHNPTLRNSTDVLVRGLDAAVAFRNLLNNVVFPLLSCSFVADTIASIQSDLCVQFTENVHKIWSGTIIEIAGSIVCVVAFFMANRRKLSVDGKHESYEMN